MSIDQLPSDFAPYHLVRLDLPSVQCMGRFYDRTLVLRSLASQRARFPEAQWGVLYDGGLLEETPAKAIKPQLHIVRKAA